MAPMEARCKKSLTQAAPVLSARPDTTSPGLIINVSALHSCNDQMFLGVLRSFDDAGGVSFLLEGFLVNDYYITIIRNTVTCPIDNTPPDGGHFWRISLLDGAQYSSSLPAGILSRILKICWRNWSLSLPSP